MMIASRFSAQMEENKNSSKKNGDDFEENCDSYNSITKGKKLAATQEE